MKNFTLYRMFHGMIVRVHIHSLYLPLHKCLFRPTSNSKPLKTQRRTLWRTTVNSLWWGGVNPKCYSRDLARFSCILCQTAFLKGWLEACLPQASQSTHDAALEKALEFLCPSDEFRDAAFLALTILDNPLVETTSLAARLNQDRRRGFCRAFDLQPKDSK